MFKDRNLLNKIAENITEYIGDEYICKFCCMSENVTYIAYKNNIPEYTIKISRPLYRTQSELQSETDWLLMLNNINMPVPVPVKINSNYVNKINEHYVVVFKYIKGEMPEYNDCNIMYEAGRLAALLHKAPKPENSDRPVWSAENMTGKKGLWGDWRENEDLSENDKNIIENKLNEIKLNIHNYKTNKYGLIHFDLRMTNIVIGKKFYAIDFDDCGYGYYIQDLASALSFMEDSNKLYELKDAWYKGYEEIAPLSDEDKNMADSFIILRRIQLLAWITSHKESDYVKTLYKGFAKKTMEILNSFK